MCFSATLNKSIYLKMLLKCGMVKEELLKEYLILFSIKLNTLFVALSHKNIAAILYRSHHHPTCQNFLK